MARPSLVNTCFRLPTERVFTAAAPTSSAKHQIASMRSEEHTSELQSRLHLVCRLLLEKKKNSHSNQPRITLLTALDAHKSRHHPASPVCPYAVHRSIPGNTLQLPDTPRTPAEQPPSRP